MTVFEQMIRDGDLAEGERLPAEREIVQEYGVSRTVAREAVLRLSNKGLVQTKPGFRPVVVKPGYDTALRLVGSMVSQLLEQPGSVRNLFDLRIMTEAALAREAALNATRDNISEMRQALEANEAAIDTEEEFYRTDTAFHAVLYEVPQNPLLIAMHRAYTDWLAPQWSAMPRMPERNRGNFEAHAAIFEAILARDPDLAETCLRQHLASAWQQISTTFEELE